MSEMKLRRLDLTLLLVLDGALRHRKLSVVAGELGLSQPAVSHALARLRQIFDDPLFLRRPGGVEPTARALDLAPRIASVLALARAAVAPPAAFDPARSERVFRLAGLDYEAARFGPPLLSRFVAAGPGLRLSFRPQARDAALRALADDEVDLAIGLFPRRPPEILTLPLYEESYLVAAAASHPALAGRETLELDAYCAMDHVLVSLDGGLEGTVDAALARLGRRRRVVAAMPGFLPALAAAGEGGFLATMPRRVVERHAGRFGLRAFAPPLAIRPFTLSVAWHRRHEGEPGLRWLLGALEAIVREDAREGVSIGP
ncbi:LysR substrate-binding domain-containing protein [Falsiroseomonas sp. HW251]|uniref:LysR substrate-binding domain-containing protein n=1 Tax=Falsiroseomonas sp. HW251 TaxID=3390998 RepID=UPI003D316DFC